MNLKGFTLPLILLVGWLVGLSGFKGQEPILAKQRQLLPLYSSLDSPFRSIK